MTAELMAQYQQLNIILQSNAMGAWFIIFVLIFALRDITRKGFALRKAGTRRELIRFICLFILNTGGILPIIYLLISYIKDEEIKQDKIKEAIQMKENKIPESKKITKKITKKTK